MLECDSSWQAHYLVMLEYGLSWHAQNLMLERHFSWQVQHLLMLECHFSWQARGRRTIGDALFVAAARCRDITWHDATPHHMTWHDISQVTTLPHLTSPHNHPQYCISPRSQPRNITYHITAHYITNTDTLRKRNQPPPKRQHQTERRKAGAHKHLGLGIALVDRPARFYRQILSLTYSFFPLKLPPPACPALFVYSTVKLGISFDKLPQNWFFFEKS